MKQHIRRIQQIHIGVFIADKKLHSYQMQEIKTYLVKKGYLVYWFCKSYRDAVPFEEWPIVDVVISFFSEGMEFLSVQKYVQKHTPLELNNIDRQFLLLDRRIVLEVLEKIGVPTANRLFFSADGTSEKNAYAPHGTAPSKNKEIQKIVKKELASFGIKYNDIYRKSATRECANGVLLIDNKRIEKPYVEKPIYSENHNINIYYGDSCDERSNGVCRLFRKTGNKSSQFERTEGSLGYRDDGCSYVYEKFISVREFVDIKAYAIGKRVYSETRKSPAKDGVVVRNKEGKEERSLVSLTAAEENAVKKTAKAFGQFICGMDILRTSPGSFFIIDVNGWSFVKTNDNYYRQSNLKELDKYIKKKILRKRAKREKDATRKEDRIELKRALAIFEGEALEVKGVHAVYRHGSRSPKMKKKLFFVSGRLAAYVQSVPQRSAGRNTKRAGEIEEILVECEKSGTLPEESKIQLRKLQEVVRNNKDVRVKCQVENRDTVKLVLKWGGLLAEHAREEIQYEAMEYESELSSLIGDSQTHPKKVSPQKCKSKLRTERKVQVIAGPEERTIETAKMFHKVLQWTDRVKDAVQEKHITYKEEPLAAEGGFSQSLSATYESIRKHMGEAAEAVMSAPEEDRAGCLNDGQKKAEGKCRCACAKNLAENCVKTCEICQEAEFFRKWQFVFSEYAEMTEENFETLIPILLDFYHCDLLQAKYSRSVLLSKHFKKVLGLFETLRRHSKDISSRKICGFFRDGEPLEIVEFLFSLVGSGCDTLYVTKRLSILILLGYVLGMRNKSEVYINAGLAREIEEGMHEIGFLCSVIMVHFSCKGKEYLLFKYSRGIGNDALSQELFSSRQAPVLRAGRKKILALMPAALFKNR